MTAESTPLRVCMVHYSDFGVDSRIQRQARALAERGDEVHLVCLSPSEELRVGAGRIVIHEVALAKAGGGMKAYLAGYAGFFARALKLVTVLDRRLRFDLVEAHNMPDFLVFTALLPKLRGVPVILNVHDTFPELFSTKFGRGPGHPIVRLLRLEEAVSARAADALITVTLEAGALLQSRGLGRSGINVVMNSPDERLFGPQRPAGRPPAAGPVRVIYHGGLARRFGAELLIRAVGSLGETCPELSLRVCGTGDEHEHLIAVAAEVARGRADVAPAPIPLEGIPAELEAADIGVVPTLRDDFTELLLPVKLLEYVHMGLPAIAPRLPVIEHYFGDDELRFFDPGSEQSLAEAIREVCAEPAAASARAARAAERLERIGWSRQRHDYLALVDRLAARKLGASTAKVREVSPRSFSAHGTGRDPQGSLGA